MPYQNGLSFLCGNYLENKAQLVGNMVYAYLFRLVSSSVLNADFEDELVIIASRF